MANFFNYTVQQFKIQPSILVPSLQIHTDGTAAPVEYMQLNGNSQTGVQNGFFVDVPLQNYTSGALTLTIDWFPLVTVASGNVVFVTGAVTTLGNSTTSIFTTTAQTDLVQTAIAVPTTGGFVKQSALTISAASLGTPSAANLPRVNLKIARAPGNVLDTYPNNIGVVGVTVSFA
jgi:hypothetical protein